MIVAFIVMIFLSELETKKLNYLTAVKFHPTIKKEVRHLNNWISIKDGIEMCEFYYQSPNLKKPLRMVAVRKNINKLKKP